LKKKVSDKKKQSEKKKVKSVLKRLVAKVKRQAQIAKLPIKAQVKIAREKLSKRASILKNVLRKITVSSKKDDAEKKVLKGMLREFAAKDLLKTVVQQRLLNKVTKKGKNAAKKGTKVPKTKSSKTKKPKTKGAKKDSKKSGKKAGKKAAKLSDSEFLGAFGKKILDEAKRVGKNVIVEAGKGAARGAWEGAKKGWNQSF